MRKGGIKEIKDITISALPTIATFLGTAASGDLSAALIATATAFTSIRLSRFVEEYSTKEKNGELKDVSQKERYSDSLIDLLKYLGKELPDEERWNVMKALFFAQVSNNTNEEDELIAYLLMEKCKQMSTVEILILKSAYELNNENGFSMVTVRDIDFNTWAHRVALKIGKEIHQKLFPQVVNIWEIWEC